MSVVTLDRDEFVGLVTLSRPEKLNALSRQVVDEFRAVLREAAADDSMKAVIVQGAGGSFSAGFDLSEEVEGGVSGAVAWHDVLVPDVEMIMELWSFPKPTIAAVQGWCLAGGCDLAMACDMIVAAADSKFGEPEIRYGSGPVTLLMPFLIGQKKTNELLFTGDVIDADEALRIGLINRIGPNGTALRGARE
jgi:enoyl-CoA hydratase